MVGFAKTLAIVSIELQVWALFPWQDVVDVGRQSDLPLVSTFYALVSIANQNITSAIKPGLRGVEPIRHGSIDAGAFFGGTFFTRRVDRSTATAPARPKPWHFRQSSHGAPRTANPARWDQVPV